MATEFKRMQQLRGATGEWANDNIVPLDGEIAVERIGASKVKLKVGDGVTPYSGLPYLIADIDNLPPALSYIGSADVTAPPPAASPGQFIIVETAGVVAASWGEPAAGEAAAVGDWLVYDSSGRWNLIHMGAVTAGGISTEDGGNVQDAIAVAETPIALIAMVDPFPVGSTIRTANGHVYKVAPLGAGDAHVTTAGGVKLYVRDPHMTPDALGAPIDGTGDAGPAIERAFQLDTTVHFLASSIYRIASVVGLPDNSLYGSTGISFEINGAEIVAHSPLTGAVPEAIFTSAAAKLAPESTSNLYAGKIFVRGGNFRQDLTSVIFNGDRLYQLSISDCSFDGVDTVIKSFRSHAGITTGYIQSVQIRGCQFSDCRRIIDARRGYDIEFSSNKCTQNAGGIYIDSDTADPAVNSLYFTNNLFQGGGLALVVGKALGLVISGCYFEANVQGDAATDKCNIRLKAGAGLSSGVTIIGCEFQPTTDQKADPAYADIRIDYVVTGGSVPFPLIMQCWTSGTALFTPARAELIGVGSNSANTFRNALVPATPASARRSYIAGPATYQNTANNLAGGIFRVLGLDVQFLKSMLIDGARPVKGEISILMQHRTVGGIVNGTSHCVIGFLIQAASEGISSGRIDDVYAAFALKDFIQIAAGQPTETTFGGTTKVHFTNPVLSVDRVGDVFNLRLSGYAAPSQANYGPADRILSQVTVELDSMNASSSARTSPLGFSTT